MGGRERIVSGAGTSKKREDSNKQRREGMIWALAAMGVAALYGGMAVYFYYGFKRMPL
jgi:hypothetical protein